MVQKRRGRQDGGDGSPPWPPAKRCRSFDLEIRGCRYLQELTASLTHRLESAIGQIPEEVTKALTNFFSHAPRPQFDQNRAPIYKLCFLNNLSDVVFTKKSIQAKNGDRIKIAIVVKNQQSSTSYRLSSVKIKIVVLDGDFNEDKQEDWTEEEFNSRIIRPRDKIGAVLTGDLEFRLNNGEAYLRDATFVDNSKFTRSGKFRLGVMLVDDIGERVQEGITEPFTVKDRRGEGSRKHDIPSLNDEVWRLKRISKDGIFHKALTGSGICLVKDFLRSYNKDKDALRKILKTAPEMAWTTIVDHAKKCEPGKGLYSYFIEEKNIRLFFNSVHQFVGATFDDHYTTASNIDRSKQILVEQWSKDAYESMTDRQPDYEMENGQPKPIDGSSFQGSCSSEPKFSELLEGHHDKVRHQVDQQGTSLGSEFYGDHSQQHTFTRLGSVRVGRLPSIQGKNDNASLDINVFLDTNVAPHYPTTAANDIPESAIPDQVISDMRFTNYGIPVSQGHCCGQEQPVFTQCATIRSQSPLVEFPAFSRNNSINLSNFHEMYEHWVGNKLDEEIGLDGDSTRFSASSVNKLPPSVVANMVKLLAYPKWLKLAAIVKCLSMLKASKSKAHASAKIVGVSERIENSGDQ